MQKLTKILGILTLALLLSGCYTIGGDEIGPTWDGNGPSWGPVNLASMNRIETVIGVSTYNDVEVNDSYAGFIQLPFAECYNFRANIGIYCPFEDIDKTRPEVGISYDLGSVLGFPYYFPCELGVAFPFSGYTSQWSSEIPKYLQYQVGLIRVRW